VCLKLRPGTAYTFTAETAAAGGGKEGSFRTPPAASDGDGGACSFVFGSCVGGQGYGRNAGAGAESGFPAFSAMSATDPDFFVCNGDIIYADNAIEEEATTFWNKGAKHVVGEGMAVANDLAGFRARYRYHLDDPKLAKLYAATPLFNTWDDHEIIDDWGAQRLIADGKGQLLEDGMRAWFDYHPHVGPWVEPRRLYRSARWGRHVELFILDCRSYRAVHQDCPEGGTPQMQTILGEAQLKWLLAGLSASTATWKFICTSIPLSYPTGWPRPEETGYDGWADGKQSDNSTGPEMELRGILQHIRDTPIRNVVFISGDVHFPFCISYALALAPRPIPHLV
jgi:alkaline phosphatase D